MVKSFNRLFAELFVFDMLDDPEGCIKIGNR